jgi:hypothetical protein
VLLSSWLLFVGRDHPRLLLGRAQRPTAPAAASSVLQLQVGALLDLAGRAAGGSHGRPSRSRSTTSTPRGRRTARAPP